MPHLNPDWFYLSSTVLVVKDHFVVAELLTSHFVVTAHPTDLARLSLNVFGLSVHSAMCMLEHIFGLAHSPSLP